MVVPACRLRPLPGCGAGRRMETEPSGHTGLRSRDQNYWLEFAGQNISEGGIGRGTGGGERGRE